jgi:hypothetical protein
MLQESCIFWDITPCSPLKFNLRFGGTYRFRRQGRRSLLLSFALVSSLLYSWTFKEAACLSETSIDFKRTTRRYIPEDICSEAPLWQARILHSCFSWDSQVRQTRVTSEQNRRLRSERFEIICLLPFMLCSITVRLWSMHIVLAIYIDIQYTLANPQ